MSLSEPAQRRALWWSAVRVFNPYELRVRPRPSVTATYSFGQIKQLVIVGRESLTVR